MADIDPTKLSEAINKALKEATDEKYIEQLETLRDELERNADKAESLADAFYKLKEAQDELNSASKTLERGTERLIKTLTGVEERSQGIIGGFGRMVSETGNVRDAFKLMGRQMAKQLTTTNLTIAATQKFAEGTALLTMGLDKATAGFAKATGTGSKYKNVIREAEARNRKYGISADQAAKATGELLGGFSEFLMMSEAAQANLATTVSSFEALGVSAGTTVKFLEAATRAGGKTRQQALSLQNSIMATANAFGDDLNIVMTEAADVLPRISIHGNKTEQVLHDLYSASKRTGFAMGDIVSMAERFDTIDSAANAAGNLNAVLGSMGFDPMIDTMTILEKVNPAERMQYFADAINQSVGHFDNLHEYQQKAIANAMGQTVEETRRLLLQEEQATTLDSAMARQNIGQTEYNKLVRESQTLMDELRILAMKFAVSLEKPLGYIKEMIVGMGNLLDKVDKAAGGGIAGGIAKGVVGVGAIAGGSMILRGMGRLLTGQSLFKPDGSKRRPWYVQLVEGGAKLFEGAKGMFNKMKERLGFGRGRDPQEMFLRGERGGGGTNFLGGFGNRARAAGHRMTGGAFARGGNLSKAARLGKFAKSGLGVGLLAGAAGYGVSKFGTKMGMSEKAAERTGGALGGAGAGAAMGSMFGPWGMGIGAALGGLGGAFGLFADGGVVTQPTVAVMGEGGQNEAVVPLPDGRKIPVDFGPGGSIEQLASKLDKLIETLSQRETVVVISDLERAGFITQRNRMKVVG